MNLWFRLIWLVLTAWRRPAMRSAADASRLSFRVLPTDVDMNIHLTNGRFLAIADLGRIDVALQTGLFRQIFRQGWAPIVSFSSVLFRRELRIWQRYDLTSQLLYWDDDIQIFEHVFRPVGGRHDGEIAASILCAASFYDRKAKAFVKPDALARASGWANESPPLTPRLKAFIDSYRAAKADARGHAIAA